MEIWVQFTDDVERMPGQLLRIRVDFQRLRRNFSAAEGREFSTCEVRHFLSEAGFVEDDDRWLVREQDLGQLRPDEVMSIEPVDRLESRTR